MDPYEDTTLEDLIKNKPRPEPEGDDSAPGIDKEGIFSDNRDIINRMYELTLNGPASLKAKYGDKPVELDPDNVPFVEMPTFRSPQSVQEGIFGNNQDVINQMHDLAINGKYGPLQIQKQPTVDIIDRPLSNEAKVLRDQSDRGNEIQHKEARFYKDNMNDILGSQNKDANSLTDDRNAALQQYLNSQSQLQDVVSGLSSTPPPNRPQDVELNKNINSTRQKYEDLQAPQPEDLLTKAIVNLFPAVGASFLGEAGERAAVPAVQMSQQINKTARDEQLNTFKIQRDNLKKLYDQLIAAKKEGAGEWDKETKLKIDQANLLLNSTKDLNTLDLRSLIAASNDMNKVTKSFNDNAAKGAENTAKLEQGGEKIDQADRKQTEVERHNPEMEKAAMKRASMMAMSYGLREESLGQREFSRIAKDPNVQKAVAAQMSLERGIQTLNDAVREGKGVPTAVLSELANDAARGLTFGGNTSEAQRNSQEFHNLNTGLADLLTKASSSGVETVNDPKLFQQLSSNFTRIHSSVVNSKAAMADALSRPSSNETVNANQTAAIGNLKGMSSAAKPPKAGDVIKGYKFKGGDPSKQSSWEKAK